MKLELMALAFENLDGTLAKEPCAPQKTGVFVGKRRVERVRFVCSLVAMLACHRGVAVVVIVA